MPARSKRIWRRRFIRAILCLLLGAVTTVGVAWVGVILPAGSSAETLSMSGGGQLWVVVARRGGIAQEAEIALVEVPSGRARSAGVAIGESAREPALRSAGEATAALLPLHSLHGSDLLMTLGIPHAVSPVSPPDGAATSATTVTSGFPFHALSMVHHETMVSALPRTVTAERRTGSLRVRSHHVPYRPTVPGFLLNMLFYATPWWLILITPGAVKRWRRHRRGRCIHCGYDLAGLPGGTVSGGTVSGGTVLRTVTGTDSAQQQDTARRAVPPTCPECGA